MSGHGTSQKLTTASLLFAIFITCLIFYSKMLYAQFLPENSHVPGGVAIIRLSLASVEKPEVSFLGVPVIVIPYPYKKNHWQAIVGLSLKLNKGRYKIDIAKPKNMSQWFNINFKQYPKQVVEIKNLRLLNPNEPDLRRIVAERRYLDKMISKITANDKIDFRMRLPVKQPLLTEFGTRRYFNGTVRHYVQGIDFQSERMHPITACNDGKVVLTGELLFEGRVILIDHGLGLYSLYEHLQKIKVKAGDKVTAKTVIGEVGQTGRTHVPTLMWEIIMNKTRVDPMLFLNKQSKLVLKYGLQEALLRMQPNYKENKYKHNDSIRELYKDIPKAFEN